MTPRDQWRTWWRDGDWSRCALAVTEAATRYVRTLGADADDCDDLVQHVLVSCWLLPYVPEEPAAFVRTATVNAWRSLRRHSARHAPLAEAIDRAADALTTLVRDEQRTALRGALRQLPDRQRRLVVLHHLHERSVRDLAAQFGMTEGAVKMALLRGRQALAAAVVAEQLRAAPSVAARLSGFFDIGGARPLAICAA